MSTVPRSFRFSKTLDDRITALMRSESRSRNNLVEMLLEEAINARAPKKKKVVGDVAKQ